MREMVVVTDPVAAEHELAQFGLTLGLAHKVARAAAVGRASALDIDVAFAPGMLAHIYGHRQLRRELLPRGWRLGRQNNVESVVNDELGVQIIFQNEDLACVRHHYPQAISAKGAGSRRLVQQGLQGELWDIPPSVESAKQETSKYGVTPTVWMFCVSDDGKRLRAELSKPDIFEGDQFGVFSKRFFLLDEEAANEPDVAVGGRDSLENELDIDVVVVKRQVDV